MKKFGLIAVIILVAIVLVCSLFVASWWLFKQLKAPAMLAE